MDVVGLLLELYGRIPETVREAVTGLDPAQLTTRVHPDTNPIGWLVWHLARVEDAQVAELAGTEQLWSSTDTAAHFGLAPDPDDTGYGHTAEQVTGVRPESAEVLLDYLDAVDARVREFLAGLTPEDLDTIVDRHWDPPVTMGVRLVSVADDCIQHAGQAGYARGLLRA